MDIKVRDSNGAQLADGDSVTLIKDLKLKGSSTVLKRGTVITYGIVQAGPDIPDGVPYIRTSDMRGKSFGRDARSSFPAFAGEGDQP